LPFLSGHELLLFGRTNSQLECAGRIYPVHNYLELDRFGQAADVFVNLAVVNNNSLAPEHEYFEVNSNLAVKLNEMRIKIGVKRFINVSSTLALNQSNLSPYACSKRQAAMRMADQPGNPETIYLGQVHGRRFSGRLAILNVLPDFVARAAFYAYAALRPTTRIDAFAEYILNTKMTGVIPIDHNEFALVDSKSANWCFRVTKRAIDVAAAVGIVIIFWWLLLLVYLAVWAQSKGSAIFRQVRVGKNETPFVCYKFRTMKVGTDQKGTHEIDASSITPLGKFLRRFKLDELPQIFNVLKNQMTLIGPRPGLPNQFELTESRRFHNVYSATPGMSGLAQVNHIDMSDPARLAKCDATYLATQGLMLDIKLILKTVFRNLKI
jgi:lipopolysaccharide/colanic/teichoic acid biosynthesis glycosyltransferase